MFEYFQSTYTRVVLSPAWVVVAGLIFCTVRAMMLPHNFVSAYGRCVSYFGNKSGVLHCVKVKRFMRC